MLMAFGESIQRQRPTSLRSRRGLRSWAGSERMGASVPAGLLAAQPDGYTIDVTIQRTGETKYLM